MNIKRALNIKNTARTALIDLFSEANHFGFTHDKMLDRRNEIYRDLGLYKCPQWVRSYLEGYWECLQQHAYQHDLVYGAIVDGTFYSTYHHRDDYYQKHGILPSAFAAENPTKGHYWSRNLKPFFVSPN